VAPAGRPLTETVTVCALPEVTCVVTVYDVLWPCTTLWLRGDALMPKSSGALTVSVTVAEREFGGFAYAPLIVSVNVPAGVDADVVTVSVEPPPARTAAGEKVPLAPAGRPASENVTVCALPDVTSVLTLYVVPSPRRMP